MKRHKLTILGVLGVLGCLALGLGPGQAQGGVITPVNAEGTPIDSSMTVSIFDTNGNDITDTWFQKPDSDLNKEVTIHVNNWDGSTPVLVTSGTIHTSAYPGTCTNYGDTTDTSLDFMLTVSGQEYTLTPLDTGGTAVISFNGNYFVIPKDSDLDGIPDWYENAYCDNGNCDRAEDADLAPVAGSDPGDGIAAIDEYRGFRVNGQYIRTSPKVKDLFVGAADEPQCADAAYYIDGSGNPIQLATYFADSDTNALFSNLYTLNPGIAVHFIKNDEWRNFFAGYSDNYGVIMDGATAETRVSNAIYDRQINTNAIVRQYGSPEPDTILGIVKGIRFVECLDLSYTSPMGIGDINPPDLLDKDNGNAIVYTQRVYHSLQYKFAAGEGRKLKYYTFENGKWVDKWTSTSSPPTEDDKNIIMKKALPWYVAHEIIHCTDLTRTDESTHKEPAGYHHVSGTGTNIDVKIVNVVDKKSSGYNKFYIPSSYGDSDKRDMRLLAMP